MNRADSPAAAERSISHSSFFTLHSSLVPLAWAAFLACSWTWCIGMFLPVLMVRDFGLLGWIVFAVPNVVGAAAMGWVLSKQGTAQRLAKDHALACQCFSAVTVAFHCFFVGWIVRAMLGWIGPALALAAAVAIYLLTSRGRRELICAVVILAASLIAFIIFIADQGLPLHTFEVLSRGGLRLAWLSPAIIFGFALCPYLDLTFLRARALTAPKAGVAAFTLGFGFFFLLMIAFTLWYSRWLVPERLDRLPRFLAWIIGVHMILQIGFTTALHARPLLASDTQRDFRFAGPLVWILCFCLPLTWQGGASGPAAAIHGETVYRMFMGFYGLVFPAYVWLCMTPSPASASKPTRHQWMVYGATVIAAAPLFYMGFIADRMIWLLPGVTLILAARFAVRKASL